MNASQGCIGWTEAANRILSAMGRTISQKRVTCEVERLMDGATLLKTSAFGDALIEDMG